MEKLADCAFITTQDRMHLEPAITFASKGYHLLLEKPMSVDENECQQERSLISKWKSHKTEKAPVSKAD